MGPALAFVQENTAQENARERAWRSSPKGLLPDPPHAGEVQTVQNDVPANPCILRHHRTFALVLDKVQSNEGLPGAKFTARSSPGSRFEPAVRTPGGPVARHPQFQGSEASPAARNTLDSARIPRASKLLICGLFQKGRVLAQDGVSTRNYESNLDKPAAKLKSRGTSKSAASRHLVSQTTKKLEQYLSRRLEEYELAALMMDGLEVAGQTVVVTLGITIDGTKVPLGIWLGSTENSQVCTAMLQDLLERGLRIDESILCVVDGGKGIRKALVDVLGDLAVIQRCHFHKLRNLRSYLPKSRHAYVLQTMKEAYKCKSADKARKQLRALVSWLERNGYDEAAGSLREGMEETLTVLKLALPELLRRSLATTNAIENLNGTIRRVSRNVKRWKSPSMIRRWTALGVVTAEKKFRRIKGYRNMGALVHALKRKQKSLDSDEFAA